MEEVRKKACHVWTWVIVVWKTVDLKEVLHHILEGEGSIHQMFIHIKRLFGLQNLGFIFLR